MSRDSQGPRKTFSKGGSSDFNKRKSFSSSDKPKRSFGKREESSEKRVRKNYGDDDRKPFVKRADGNMKVFHPENPMAKEMEKNGLSKKEKIMIDRAEVLVKEKEDLSQNVLMKNMRATDLASLLEIETEKSAHLQNAKKEAKIDLAEVLEKKKSAHMLSEKEEVRIDLLEVLKGGRRNHLLDVKIMIDLEDLLEKRKSLVNLMSQNYLSRNV